MMKYLLQDTTPSPVAAIVIVLLLSTGIIFFTSNTKAEPLTINQIHQRVHLQFKGKIIATRYTASSNVYTINLLQHDGSVQQLRFNAETGKLISRSPVKINRR